METSQQNSNQFKSKQKLSVWETIVSEKAFNNGSHQGHAKQNKNEVLCTLTIYKNWS